LDDLLTIAAQVSISQIVCHNKNDIGTGGFFCGGTAARQKSQKQKIKIPSGDAKQIMVDHDLRCVCSNKDR
jgi:hypothetical protein